MVCSRGESLTHHMNQMKLFNAIATAAVVGAAFAVVSPSAQAQSDFHRRAAHAQCRYSPSSAAYNNCMRGEIQKLRSMDRLAEKHGMQNPEQMLNQAAESLGMSQDKLQLLFVN